MKEIKKRVKCLVSVLKSQIDSGKYELSYYECNGEEWTFTTKVGQVEIKAVLGIYYYTFGDISCSVKIIVNDQKIPLGFWNSLRVRRLLKKVVLNKKRSAREERVCAALKGVCGCLEERNMPTFGA